MEQRMIPVTFATVTSAMGPLDRFLMVRASEILLVLARSTMLPKIPSWVISDRMPKRLLMQST